MTQAAVRQEDFATGRIWLAFEALALVVTVVALLIVAALVLSSFEVELGPGAPAGVGGVDLLDCAPPIDWLRRSPGSLCQPATRSILVAVLVVGAVAASATGLFVVARRRRRWLKAERSALGTQKVLRSYRQDSMPWAYWSAVVLVGGLSLLMVIGGLVALVRGSGAVTGAGIGLWASVAYAVAWVYGRRRGYSVAVVDGELEWRAPLRRRRFPLVAVRSAQVRRTGWVLAEREASLAMATGEKILIVVPNARHERRFLAFCAAITCDATFTDGADAAGRPPA